MGLKLRNGLSSPVCPVRLILAVTVWTAPAASIVKSQLVLLGQILGAASQEPPRRLSRRVPISVVDPPLRPCRRSPMHQLLTTMSPTRLFLTPAPFLRLRCRIQRFAENSACHLQNQHP